MIPVLPTVVWKLLAIIAVAVMSFAAGIKVRGDHEAAKQLTLERGWNEAYKQGVARSQEVAANVGAALRDEQSKRVEEAAQLRARLNRERGRVVLASCPEQRGGTVTSANPAEAVVAGVAGPVLTDDFRLRYDTALSLVVPASDRARWTDAAGAATGAVDLWAVLNTHTENASRWAQCREMMTAAQQWFKTMGWN